MSGELRRFLSAGQIAGAVERLGAAISADHPGGVVVVGVLKGGAILVADLLRSISVPCVVDFLALSPYADRGTRVRILKDLGLDVTDRDVVLVEGVVDTGLSASYLVRLLGERGAARVSVCALLERPGRRIVPLALAYTGFVAPDAYLVGYGLDARGRYRNLPEIVELAGVEAPAGSGDEATGDPARAGDVAAALYGSRWT